jgi:hypothetical protein
MIMNTLPDALGIVAAYHVRRKARAKQRPNDYISQPVPVTLSLNLKYMSVSPASLK